ncbi:MAG: DUF937 domain-containing protein, partial [Firmicutes bacterium]|nr:DUF937 domain-containing protein [Bacillota bacterium]
DEVKSVLLSALPAMLSGAKGQASNRDTAAGFAGALDSHAKDDTSDVTAFLSHVDIKDGDKIVGHLLGGDKEAATRAAAKKAGLSTAATGSILGAAAPLLMSLLGQQVTQAVQAQTQTQTVLPTGGAQQASSSGVGLLAGLLGGGQQPAATQQQGLGGLLGSLLGGAQPQQAAAQQQGAESNPLGSLVGGMLGSGDVTSLLSGLLGSGK